MGIVGRIWLDGQRVSGEVLAFINGQQCGRGKAEGTPPKPLLLLPISSDAHQPGCGVPGATITFTINGRAANETVAWKPGITQQMVTLSAGPRIAIYQGTLRIDRGRPPPMRVVPYIGGVVCGAAVAPWFLITDDARWSYEVVVDPDGLRLGCGRAGVDVTLRLQVAGQPDIDLATVPWEALPPTQILTVDLTGRIPTAPGDETGPPNSADGG